MSERYQNKFRIASARATWWDYGWAGVYFITICTQHRSRFFGEIINGKMRLSGAGILADVCWHTIPQHACNVELGAFTVMPNHIHGILILNGNGKRTGNGIAGGNTDAIVTVAVPVAVETRHALSLPIHPIHPNPSIPAIPQTIPATPTKPVTPSTQTPSSAQPSKLLPSTSPSSPAEQRFQNQGKNTVSSIIGSYKSAVTKHANRLGILMAWQARFHDHIISNDSEYQRINDYIETNPMNWEKDKFFNAEELEEQF